MTREAQRNLDKLPGSHEKSSEEDLFRTVPEVMKEAGVRQGCGPD